MSTSFDGRPRLTARARGARSLRPEIGHRGPRLTERARRQVAAGGDRTLRRWLGRRKAGLADGRPELDERRRDSFKCDRNRFAGFGASIALCILTIDGQPAIVVVGNRQLHKFDHM